MIGLLLLLVLLVILLMAVVVAAFGTLGIVAVVPVGAALIWFALTRSPGEPPAAPESTHESEWRPSPRKRDPASPD